MQLVQLLFLELTSELLLTVLGLPGACGVRVGDHCAKLILQCGLTVCAIETVAKALDPGVNVTVLIITSYPVQMFLCLVSPVNHLL